MVLLGQRHSKLGNELQETGVTRESPKMTEAQEEDLKQRKQGQIVTCSGKHTHRPLESSFSPLLLNLTSNQNYQSTIL